jgi:hypothetical protein
LRIDDELVEFFGACPGQKNEHATPVAEAMAEVVAGGCGLTSSVFGPVESCALPDWLRFVLLSPYEASFARGRAAGGQKSWQVVGDRENKDLARVVNHDRLAKFSGYAGEGPKK